MEITDLALSTPVNNDYSLWRHHQCTLYDNKVTEHVFPGGENGCQMEAGAYAPSLPLAFGLAWVFGVTVEEVFQ